MSSMRGRQRAIFGGAATSSVVADVPSSSDSRTEQGSPDMQERKQTINGHEVTVLVHDDDAEAFDAAQAEAEQAAKSKTAQNKARKSVANKSS